MTLRLISTIVLLTAGVAAAQATRPAGRPGPAARPSTQPATAATNPAAGSMSADEMLNQMLRPPPATGAGAGAGGAAAPGTGARALPAPTDPPALDRSSGPAAVKPDAPAVTVLREGRYLNDRVGRLHRSADGAQAEFVFESDGRTLRDPPVVILPSLKLMAMENAVAGSNRDMKFRITGMVTEYRGRNYVLLDKVVVIPDVIDRQF